MSDEEKIPDFKAITMVVWVSIATAIIVTIIDWKIKQDILRLTDAFYRVYQDRIIPDANENRPEPEVDRRPDSDRVLHLHRVDNDSGMEEGVLPQTVPPSFSSAHPAIFRGIPAELERELQPGTASDSERLPEGSVELSGSDSE